MKPGDNIEKRLRQIEFKGSAEMHNRILDDVFKAQAESEELKSASTEPYIRRIIMKNTTNKLAVAAVILLVVGIGLAVLSTSDYNPIRRAISEPVVQDDTVKLEAAQTKLAAELKKIKQLFAAGDVKALVGVLAGDEYEYESKVAAANYLADIGDESSLAELEKLSNEWTGEDDENPFTAAIEVLSAGTVAVAAEGAETADTAGESEAAAAVDSGTVEKVGDELLGLVPAKSLFCLRVNNFDSTVGLMDQYSTGVSPVPFGVSMLVRMQLAGLLGDPALKNINTQGNFAIYGVGLPSQTDQSMQKGKMFIAALMPVADYAKMVSENPNYSEPDANGVSLIKAGGTTAPDKTRLAVQLGGYVLVCISGNYDELVSMATLTAGGAGLGASLGNKEVKAAMTEPAWAYGNIQQVSKVFGPVLVQGLEQMKKQIEKMNESGKGGPPSTVMNLYFGMLDVVLNEVEFFSVSIRSKANVCSMAINMAAVPKTLMAKMFVADASATTENRLWGYLQDGAIFNVGIRKNTAFWKEYSLSQFDFMSFLSEDGIDEEILDKLEKITSQLIASAGRSGAVSFGSSSNSESLMPFAARYIFEVKDAEKWEKAMEDAMDFWNVYAKNLAQMGIDGSYEIERDVNSYREVSIDAAKYTLKATDANTDFGKMIDQMYAGGFDYRFAMVDDLWLCVFGDDSDAAIRQLIDQVKAGGPSELAPEFAAGLTFITEPNNADFLGTINAVRYLKMAGEMAQALKDMPGAMTPHLMPEINVPSNSNIAFAGRVGDGTITFEFALPKDHLLEIKTAGEIMTQKMMEAQKAAAEKAASQVEDTNSTGEVNDANGPDV